MISKTCLEKILTDYFQDEGYYADQDFSPFSGMPSTILINLF